RKPAGPPSDAPLGRPFDRHGVQWTLTAPTRPHWWCGRLRARVCQLCEASMSRPLEVVLLLALPASGKSEVRTYLASVPAGAAANDFRLGPTVKLDDYPYVHIMRRISEELRARGQDGVFFRANDEPLVDPRDWGTLIELVNEDYEDLRRQPTIVPES